MIRTLLTLIVMLCSVALSQEHTGAESPRQSETAPLPQPEEQPSSSQPGQVLPPLPPPEEMAPLPVERIFIREIRVTGSTVFSDAALAQVTAPYVNRELTAEDLEELRLALTQLYFTQGYVTSGAMIPDQTITEGVVTLHIIEGELQRIDVEGNRWFRTGYLRRRLALSAGPPVQITALQQRLQLLQQDERIERLNAELRPGVQRGESMLHVRVTETLPFHVALEFNNHQSPTVGAERGLVTVAHQNLTGHGDILSVSFGRSAGLALQVDASYTLPLTAYDTTLGLRYRRNETVVVEGPFPQFFNIVSESDVFGLTIRHPFYRTLTQEFATAFTFEHERSQTFIDNRPLDEESVVTAGRLSLEWLNRTQNQVLAARARLSVGLDILGATIIEPGSARAGPNPRAIADGEFLAWVGQVQWARRLTDWDLQTLFRLTLQLSTDPLPALEQLAVGGRFSVRGYRENQLVRDNGLLVSLEFRLPLVRNTPWAEVVQLAPFVDFGQAWNSRVPTPEPRIIASIGIGLRWSVTIPFLVPIQPQLEVYWGYPLQDVKTAGGDLQDLGLHLQFVLAAF